MGVGVGSGVAVTTMTMGEGVLVAVVEDSTVGKTMILQDDKNTATSQVAVKTFFISPPLPLR